MKTTKLTKGMEIRKEVGGRFECGLVDFSNVDTFEHLRDAVKGRIDVVSLPNNIDIWINDEGKINGMKPNVALLDKNGEIFDILYGDLVVLASDSEGDTLPLTKKQADYFSSMLGNPVILSMGEEREVVVLPTLKFQ